MTIRTKLNALVVLLFLSIFIVSGLKIFYLSVNLRDDRRAMEASSLLGDISAAIITLSFERSIVQVTSNLPDPIPANFKALLEEQRKKADGLFNAALSTLESNKNLNGADSYRAELQNNLQKLADLRAKADAALAVTADKRDAQFVSSWPTVMPALIETIEKSRVWGLAQTKSIPTTISALFEIQHNAWRLREFGGRDRTYMAIATALARPLTQAEIDKMRMLEGPVNRSMHAMDVYEKYLQLPASYSEKLDVLKKGFGGSYKELRKSIIEDSIAGKAPAITFDAFFKTSSDALNETESLFFEAQSLADAYFKSRLDADTQALYFNIALVLASLAIALYMGRSISHDVLKPLARVQSAIDSLAKQNYEVDLSDEKRSNEIGRLATSTRFFRDTLMETDRLRDEQEALKRKSEEDRKATMLRIAEDFDSEVGNLLRALQMAADGMASLAEDMQNASHDTLSITRDTGASANQTESNVQTVASATEELSASIGEISAQLDAAARKASVASENAEQTRLIVSDLTNMAESIGSVVGAIRDIADQTNLLALNATIEAARAGDAGKGFAVVADEVKKLASETSSRTDSIEKQVQDIQNAIAKSVGAMERIITNVKEINAATTSIAGAVEEQNAATGEISRNVTEAARGSQIVNQAIARVSEKATTTGDSAQEVLAAAHEVQTHAKAMLSKVDGFVKNLRAA